MLESLIIQSMVLAYLTFELHLKLRKPMDYSLQMFHPIQQTNKTKKQGERERERERNKEKQRETKRQEQKNRREKVNVVHVY